MTAFQKGIICIGFVIGFLCLIKWHASDMTIVYPDKCIFVIDHLLSRSMQIEIKTFIDAAYKKSKSPSGLLPKIESHFSAVKSVVIDMQNPEALNFSIQTYKPIFLLNNEHVICQYAKIFTKDTFSKNELLKLENVSFDGALTTKSIDYLITFFESLTDPILKEFSVRWIDKHAIWLDQKQNSGQALDLSLLVGYKIIPTHNDILQCRKLRGQISDKPCKNKRDKPCKNNMSWVCDLRFDQQIVLFSTNKGV